MGALYISQRRSGINEWLIKYYRKTDQHLNNITAWKILISNNKIQFDTKEQFIDMLNDHRFQLDASNVTVHYELDLYSDLISVFSRWIYDAIKETRSGVIWRDLVSYQEIIKSKDNTGKECALGSIFFTFGKFPIMKSYFAFLEAQDKVNSSFESAKHFSSIDINVYNGTLTAQVDDIHTLSLMRDEVRQNIPGNPHSSLHAQWWFDNMTVLQNLLMDTQIGLAENILGVLDQQEQDDICNLLIISIVLTLIIVMTPIIIYKLYSKRTVMEMCYGDMTSR